MLLIFWRWLSEWWREKYYFTRGNAAATACFPFNLVLLDNDFGVQLFLSPFFHCYFFLRTVIFYYSSLVLLWWVLIRFSFFLSKYVWKIIIIITFFFHQKFWFLPSFLLCLSVCLKTSDKIWKSFHINIILFWTNFYYCGRGSSRRFARPNTTALQVYSLYRGGL